MASSTRRSCGAERKLCFKASSSIAPARLSTIWNAREKASLASSGSSRCSYTSPIAAHICQSSPGRPISCAWVLASCRRASAYPQVDQAKPAVPFHPLAETLYALAGQLLIAAP